MSLQAFACHRGAQYGMLDDIRETPAVIKSMLSRFLLKTDPSDLLPRNGDPATGSSLRSPSLATRAKSIRIDLPGMDAWLPSEHGLTGRTPLEVMAACSRRCTNRVMIIGSGSSHHAALAAEYLIEHIARVPVAVALASEFMYGKPIARPGDVFIVVSSSGETVDAVESLRRIKSTKHGGSVLTVAVVNEAESTVARESDAVIHVGVGDERGVASTKVFSSTIVAFVLLAVALGEQCGVLSAAEKIRIVEMLEEIPDKIQQVIQRESRALMKADAAEHSLQVGECKLWDLGAQNVLSNNFIFLGRGFNYPIALEGAMKCKEIAYIHAEGYPAAEMKHGPIALIDQFMPVIVIAPRSDPCYEKIRSNIEEVNARCGATIAITEDDNHELDEICEYVIHVPRTHEYLMPLVTMIPLQLLSYMMGVLRGNEVDHPRGLLKTISSTDTGRGLSSSPVSDAA